MHENGCEGFARRILLLAVQLPVLIMRETRKRVGKSLVYTGRITRNNLELLGDTSLLGIELS